MMAGKHRRDPLRTYQVSIAYRFRAENSEHAFEQFMDTVTGGLPDDAPEYQMIASHVNCIEVLDTVTG
jgi:hypothetical protein